MYGGAMTDSVLPASATQAADPTFDGDPTTSAPLSRNIATELFGTTLLMLAGPGLMAFTGSNVGTLGVALSVGLALAISIGVIGAVANPMFTLALLVVKEISPREATGDWIGQLLGGVVGGALIWGINDLERVAPGSNGWDRNGFGALGSVVSAELVFGVLTVVVLLLSISQGFSKASIAAFTGAMYAVGHLALIGIDGGGLNPARSIGSAIFSDTNPNALGQVWVFVLVPLVAAVAGVFVWLAIDDAEIDDTIFDDTILDDAQNALTGDQD